MLNSGKLPILQYFDLNGDLLCRIFGHSSNFHSDDIRYAWKDFERNQFRTKIASSELCFLEEQGFITKENGFQLLDIFVERGNAECAAALLRYFSENHIFDNDMDELHLE